jgi:hypothetical protein
MCRRCLCEKAFGKFLERLSGRPLFSLSRGRPVRPPESPSGPVRVSPASNCHPKRRKARPEPPDGFPIARSRCAILSMGTLNPSLTAGHINSVTNSICLAFHEKPRETRVLTTENSASLGARPRAGPPETYLQAATGSKQHTGSPRHISLVKVLLWAQSQPR